MQAQKTTYELWQEGELQGETALPALYQTLASIKDSLEPLEDMQKTVRAQISEVVQRDFNGLANLEGVAQIRITEPSKIISYDWRKLDALVIQLTNAGYHEIARDITQCRSESGRVGGLRIDLIRQK